MKYLLIILTCLAFESLGDIIYSGEQNISLYGGGPSGFVDLNSDSFVDVDFRYSQIADSSQTDSGIVGLLDAYIQGSNRIVVASLNSFDAGLPFNTLISGTLDPSLEWKNGTYFAGRVSDWSTHPTEPEEEWDWSGLFGETGNAYIGVSIAEMDGPHYGWINIVRGPEDPFGFDIPIITGWAYESDPNTAIMAGAIPEPSSGILTMIGTLSLLQLARSRRRSKQGCTPMPRCRSPQVRCGFSAERRVAQVSYGNADRISALRSRRRIQMESAAPEKW